MKNNFNKKRNQFIFILLLFVILYNGCKTTPVQTGRSSESTPRVLATKHFDEGIRLNFERNYRQAVNSFTNAIEIDPSFQGAYTVRGTAYFVLEMYHEALQDYDKAISLGPQDYTFHTTAFYMRGRTYIELEEYEKAVNDFTRLLFSMPLSWEAYKDRGIANIFLERYEEALLDLNKSIEINPNNKEGYMTRGSLYAKLADLTDDINIKNEYIERARADFERGEAF